MWAQQSFAIRSIYIRWKNRLKARRPCALNQLGLYCHLSSLQKIVKILLSSAAVLDSVDAARTNVIYFLRFSYSTSPCQQGILFLVCWSMCPKRFLCYFCAFNSFYSFHHIHTKPIPYESWVSVVWHGLLSFPCRQTFCWNWRLKMPENYAVGILCAPLLLRFWC